MSIILPKYILDRFIRRAEREAPVESCGLLGGKDNRVEAYVAMTNTENSPEHFALDPGEQSAAVKTLRKNAMKIMGVIHSHPAKPACMSDGEKRLALGPGVFYFILSLKDATPELKAFRPEENFTEVPVRVAEEKDPFSLRIPDTVIEDVRGFRQRVDRFVRGREDRIRFRAYRVPMGMYEQRTRGTFMVRVRLTGGVVSAQQIRTLADAAETYGNGVLHITTRQDIQLHDVVLENAPDVFENLLAAGLVCRGGGGNTVRTVTADPFAGIDPEEVFDVSPCAIAVTEHLLRSRSSFNLPRKYKIAFSATRADRADTFVADLGFIPVLRDDRKGFRVTAGGGMGAVSRTAIKVMDFLPRDRICHMAEAVKRVFDKHGDRSNRRRARLRFVLERMGEDRFRDVILSEYNTVCGEDFDPVPVRERHVLDLAGREPERVPAGVFAQAVPGLYAIEIRPLMGNIQSSGARNLADAIQQYGLEVRTTQKQGMLLRNVRGQDMDGVFKAVRGIDPSLVEPVPAKRPVVCPGASTCQLGLCLSRNLAHAILEGLEALPDDALSVLPQMKINGCPNACGQHPTGTLSFSGEARRKNGRLAPFYKVWAGAEKGDGSSLARDMGSMPARNIPVFIKTLGLEFSEKRRTNETFRELAGRDFSEVALLVKRFSDLPSPEEAPEYYQEWYTDEDFSLSGRGPGECGAGVMDVIKLDLDTAENLLREYDSDGNDDTLYEAAISAMRSLLITRGVDSKKDREVMTAFRTHFIDAGWVDPKTAGLIDLLLDFKIGDRRSVSSLRRDITALLRRVRDLYQSLDRRLSFTIEPFQETSAGADGEASSEKDKEKHLDLSGIPCPMNYVKAKVFMEGMAKGEILEIILDTGEPVKNVPESFSGAGQEVLGVTPCEDKKHYKLRVKKRI